MTATITLFEHEAEDFNWENRDLAALDRLNRAAGVDILRATVRGGKRKLQATQHVGVVRLGNRTIQVLPKIYRDVVGSDSQQRTQEATHNLLCLLEHTQELPVHQHALAPLLQQNLDWFEILTRLFASHLITECQRGVYRGYQIIEDELPVLKGKWRVADQFRRPERNHIFSVAYDEFTADNVLNRVFRFVVERLWRFTRDANNRQQLGELRQWLDEVSVLPSVTVDEANPSLLTRLNRRYEPLLNLARLFLDNSVLQLAAGKLTTFAFVFDMNRLFEAFAVNFIRRHRIQILPSDLAQPEKCRLHWQSRGITCYLARRNGRGIFRLKPDLVLQKADRTIPLLLDTKYKVLDADSRKLGIASSDLYQMFTYAHR